MSGSGVSAFNEIFSSCPSPSTSPPASIAPEASPPDEFLCPLSRRLMGDPVVVPTGHSFERSCIQACKELIYIPPLLLSSPSSANPIDLSSSSLFPNLALKGAILCWCDSFGLPYPPPLSQAAARSLVKGLKNGSSGGDEREESGGDQEPSPNTPAADAEESIFQDLTNAGNIAAQAAALDALFQHAKSRGARSVSLCTPRIVASIALLLRPDHTLQDNACNAILALSLTQANRIKIAGSGAVPPLLRLLAGGAVSGCRIDAARTICNLAEDERARAIVGGLGAIPPLLESFFDGSLSHVARREASMALIYLTLCPRNLAILANMAAVVGRLLSVATDGSSGGAIVLRTHAMHLLMNLARGARSVGDLIDSGAVGSMVKMVIEEQGMDSYCLTVLHQICINSPPRFREAAMDAGAEEVLAADKETWRRDCRKMAKTMLKAIRGTGGQSSGRKLVLDNGESHSG